MDRIIFGIVGPSGSGKTTVLIIPAIKKIPYQVASIKTYTTREWRDETDDPIYDFTTHAHMEQLQQRSELIQCVFFGGNYYGNTHQQVNGILNTRHGIIALTEEGVHNFQEKGYHVVAVNVVPIGIPTRDGDIRRKKDDKSRALVPVEYFHVIENHYGEEGKAKALQQLIDIIVCFPLS